MAKAVHSAEQHPVLAELRLLRLAHGWSLDSVARRLGTGTSTVHHWEAGRRAPRIASVAAFADALGYELVLQRKAEPLAEITPQQAARNRAILAWAEGRQDDYTPPEQTKETA